MLLSSCETQVLSFATNAPHLITLIHIYPIDLICCERQVKPCHPSIFEGYINNGASISLVYSLIYKRILFFYDIFCGYLVAYDNHISDSQCCVIITNNAVIRRYDEIRISVYNLVTLFPKVGSLTCLANTDISFE